MVGYIAKSPTTSQVATATGATGALMEAPSYIRAVWRASSVNMGGGDIDGAKGNNVVGCVGAGAHTEHEPAYADTDGYQPLERG